MKLIGLNKLDEELLRSICSHEASHFLVADVFGLSPKVFVAGPHSGICRHSPGVAWQNGAIAWAGFIGAALLAGEVSAASFNDWLNTTLYSPDGMDKLRQCSEPDVLAIEAEASRSRELARIAFTILNDRYDTLKSFTFELADLSRERFRFNQDHPDRAEKMCLLAQ